MSDRGLDRRSFLAGGAAGAGGLLAASGPSAASHRRRQRPRGRPNILWFISDDASTYLGAYRDPVARTPTLDALTYVGVPAARCLSMISDGRRRYLGNASRYLYHRDVHPASQIYIGPQLPTSQCNADGTRR